MKTFILAIGGSGARVLRSLTVLLASGCKTSKDNEIIPIIIDYDQTNGDLSRTVKLMENYQKVRQEAFGNNEKDNVFFATKIKMLNELNTAGVGQIGSTFNVNMGPSMPFGNYIGYNKMNDNNGFGLTRSFLESLYDKSNDACTELNLQLDYGFKGNPNIGSVVFDNIMDTPEYKYFEQSVAQGDRIFLISSIFGGTGASGFPQLVQAIRKSNNTNICNAKIGACVMMPYFKVNHDAAKAIDSELFNSKTKAGLMYYHKTKLNNMINAIYYIGDTSNGLYNNEEGGQNQKNDAHIVELVSAMSILDFINKNDNDLINGSAFEFGCEKELDQKMNISHFTDATKDKYLFEMVKFAYFQVYYNNMLRNNLPNNSPYATQMGITDIDNLHHAFYDSLKCFFDKTSVFYDELEKNAQRGYKPFDFNYVKLNDFLEHKHLRRNIIGSGPINADLFHKEMSKSYVSLQNDTSMKREEMFLQMSWDSMTNIVNIAKTSRKKEE